jgi:hypothetical protein
MTKVVKQKRITVYVPEKEYELLRIKLIQIGKSVSGWFREIMHDFLQE